MIIFLYGNAFNKLHKKQKDIINSLKKKRPGSEVFFVNEETFDKGKMEELLYGRGLFDEKYITVLKNLLKNDDSQKYILSNLKNLKESPHVFILVEESVTKALLKKISEYSYIVEDISLKKTIEKDFNIFSFTDAVGERDKLKAWIILNEGLMYGKDIENFYNLFFWLIKGIKAAQIFSSFTDAGMKPYPYNKARLYSKNYTPQELEKISLELLNAPQKERKGITSLRSSVERLILDL